MWVPCYSEEYANIILTNNGLERLHRSLKEWYLSLKGDNTLSSTITFLIRFVKDKTRKYMEFNKKSLITYRKYAKNVPIYLYNKPTKLSRELWLPAKILVYFLKYFKMAYLINTTKQILATHRFNSNYFKLRFSIWYVSLKCEDFQLLFSNSINSIHLTLFHHIS